MIKGKFTLDGIGTFEGWHDPNGKNSYWNGFSIPFFEKAEADRILQELVKAGYAVAHHDEEDDSYYTQCNVEDCADVWSPSVHDTMTLWSIGGMAWCWTWEMESGDDKIRNEWRNFLRQSLFIISDEELTALNEISNGNTDPAETMNDLFSAIENEMKTRSNR